MASVKITWHGPRIKGLVDNAVRQGMTATVADAAAMAQTLAPVDTGALKNSIRFEPASRSGKGWKASISSNMAYSIHQELGTRFQRGTPHIRPAADRVFPSLPSRIKALGG